MAKKYRSSTETKISSATMPTNAAAINSIPSMKRSIARRMELLRHRAVLFQCGDQVGVDGVGIEACGFHLTGPFGLQRLGGFAPKFGLLRGDLINFVARHSFELGMT